MTHSRRAFALTSGAAVLAVAGGVPALAKTADADVAAAVEALVTLQEQLNDDYLIPSQLNNLYDKFAEAWATLPLEVLSRINYLIGRISYRRQKFEDAKARRLEREAQKAEKKAAKAALAGANA